MAHDLILLRHGRSEWNDRNLFTGWHDCALNDAGRAEALRAAELLSAAGLLPGAVHTSVLRRATETTEIVLGALGLDSLEVHRSWRLNERHYGDLTGLDKAATLEAHGAEQLQRWRRGYDTPPPPIRDNNEFNPNHSPAYADLAPELIPLTESLADVLARMLPYWHDAVVADLHSGHTVMVSAHGNSLRALAKHLDRISDERHRRAQHPHRHAPALRPGRRHAPGRVQAPPGARPGPRGRGRRGRRGSRPSLPLSHDPSIPGPNMATRAASLPRELQMASRTSGAPVSSLLQTDIAEC